MNAARHAALDAARAFVTLLVVAHHAVLAYAGFVPAAGRPFAQIPLHWSAFPVVDEARWRGFDVLILLNDSFFMPLMFLLAGLFVRDGLRRKGPATYLRQRAYRLGYPFLFCVVVLAPLAYWPSYLQSGGTASAGAFVAQWLALDHQPPGPAWFLAVLLACDTLAAGLAASRPGALTRLGDMGAAIVQRPWKVFVLLAGLGLLLQTPLLLHYGEAHWFAFGPLSIQASRCLLYPMYYLVGMALAAGAPLFLRDAALARHWRRWLGFALGLFVLFLVTKISVATFIAAIVAPLTCAATSLAVLACFARRPPRVSPAFRFATENAYGVFILHYALVSWLQYSLLSAPLPALVKGLCVFIVATGLAASATAVLRRLGWLAGILGNRPLAPSGSPSG